MIQKVKHIFYLFFGLTFCLLIFIHTAEVNSIRLVFELYQKSNQHFTSTKNQKYFYKLSLNEKEIKRQIKDNRIEINGGVYSVIDVNKEGNNYKLQLKYESIDSNVDHMIQCLAFQKQRKNTPIQNRLKKIKSLNQSIKALTLNRLTYTSKKEYSSICIEHLQDYSISPECPPPNKIS